ncbi:hypothetical protein VNO77_15358 [Canavalia gladiata]|uniref:Uncharacterized protein n=1 Tax=Canavalia gladiata TaxID=3824 RepID=A0AAN9M073_CANGL
MIETINSRGKGCRQHSFLGATRSTIDACGYDNASNIVETYLWAFAQTESKFTYAIMRSTYAQKAKLFIKHLGKRIPSGSSPSKSITTALIYMLTDIEGNDPSELHNCAY